MRPRTHALITEKIVDSLNISGDKRNGIIKGARDADTILGNITLGHYFTAKSPEMSGALHNIMEQLKRDDPIAMGVACHLCQDVALPVHSAPLEFLHHIQWEGYIDKHLAALMEDVYVATDMSYYPELLLIYNEISNRSYSMLDGMIKAWNTDKPAFNKLACKCLQAGVNGSVFILENWDRIKK